MVSLYSCTTNKSEKNIERIEEGQSEEIVLSIMGKPDGKTINALDSSELIYFYAASPIAAGRIEIYFDTVSWKVERIRDHDSW
ncbi:MAG: hypothetical protein HRT61_20760 [Ekhidna sp.]|nr:hypothetical protein [Ekhidna sp.]